MWNSRRSSLALATAAGVLFVGCVMPLKPTSLPPGSTPETQSNLAASPAQVGGGSHDANGDYFPLGLGSRWRDERTTTTRVTLYGSPQPPILEQSLIDRELVCVDEVLGRPYVVEREVHTSENVTLATWVRYRQDPTGLYEADVQLAIPPQCESSIPGRGVERLSGGKSGGGGVPPWEGLAPEISDPAERLALRAAWERLRARLSAIRGGLGLEPGALARGLERSGGAGEGELTRLQYPLHTGARWVIRADPLFSAEVEGVERLDLPVGRVTAYRLRISSVFQHSNDVVRQWVGRAGFLQLVVHVESDATDESGNIIGTIVFDDHQVLREISLSGPGRFAGGAVALSPDQPNRASSADGP